jgi:hypothetical protein
LSFIFVLKSAFGSFPQICHAASFLILVSSLVATPSTFSKVVRTVSSVAGAGGAVSGIGFFHHGTGTGGGVFPFAFSAHTLASCSVQYVSSGLMTNASLYAVSASSRLFSLNAASPWFLRAMNFVSFSRFSLAILSASSFFASACWRVEICVCTCFWILVK